jgi:O-antigen/teichoic acid export membrane protein
LGWSGQCRRVPETEKERYERNFADLLQELRVAQTGVQILFAFLLTLPFSAAFGKVSQFQKDVYVVALLAAAGAAALLIAPVAYHRMLFQRGRKAELVRSAHRMASGGLAFMLVAMVSAVLLITDFILERWVAWLLSGLTAVWFLLLWVLLPLLRRDDRDEPEENPTAR